MKHKQTNNTITRSLKINYENEASNTQTTGNTLQTLDKGPYQKPELKYSAH